MAHPARGPQVKDLLARLDREVPVCWDSGPASTDLEKVWANARRTWETHDPEADWHMLIQDDALVVPDLLAGLEKALEHVPPDVIVQPYVGTKRPNVGLVDAKVAAAEAVDASWIRMRSLMWGVATVVPVREIPQMIEWCSRRERRGWSDDKRVGRYFRDVKGWPTLYPWPSLVDHRQGPSLCGHDDGGRRARRLWPRSALLRDWSGPVVDDVRPNRFVRSQAVKTRVRMSHPRGRGARLIPEHDVPRWRSRGWQVADEPDRTAPAVGPEPGPEPDPELDPEPEPAAPENGPEPTVESVPDSGEVRAWARDNGYEVSPRGKLPQRVIDAYEAAHA